jgi:LEA14-like dessication related protein
MKLIKLNNPENFPLTVDNTSITVDDTNITVDLSESNNTFKIVLLPRKTVTNSVLKLENELTKVKHNLETNNLIVNGYLHVYFTLEGIVDKSSFNATLESLEGELLWRGKLFATTSENIQEYSMNTKTTTNKIIL